MAFELVEALGFGNDEEEMRRAEQFFMEMFLEKQRRTELLQGEAAAPKSSPWQGCSNGSGTRGSSSKKSSPRRPRHGAPGEEVQLLQGEQPMAELLQREQPMAELLQGKQHEVQLLQEELPMTELLQGKQHEVQLL